MNGLELGPHWSAVEVLAEQVQVFDVGVHLFGCSAKGPGGRIATGSAAALDSSPSERAYFELVERTSILSAVAAPERELEVVGIDGRARGSQPSACIFPAPNPAEPFAYSLSNGVALGTSWMGACEAARLELV